MATNAVKLPFLEELIDATNAPVTISEYESTVSISVPDDHESRYARREFWMGFAGKMYSSISLGNFSAVSCTIRSWERGEPIPPSIFERILSGWKLEAVPRRAPDRIMTTEILNPSFKDCARGVLRNGGISLVISKKEHERLKRPGIRSEPLGTPFSGEFRMIVQPVEIMEMVFSDAELAKMQMFCF